MTGTVAAWAQPAACWYGDSWDYRMTSATQRGLGDGVSLAAETPAKHLGDQNLSPPALSPRATPPAVKWGSEVLVS